SPSPFAAQCGGRVARRNCAAKSSLGPVDVMGPPPNALATGLSPARGRFYTPFSDREGKPRSAPEPRRLGGVDVSAAPAALDCHFVHLVAVDRMVNRPEHLSYPMVMTRGSDLHNHGTLLALTHQAYQTT